MKTAISIPDPLFDAAESLAARLGISRSELYQRAVREFIKRHRHDLVTERLDAVYGAEDAVSTLDPVLRELQAETLLDEDW